VPQYVALVHKESDGCYGVSFPDLPGVITGGDSIDEALEQVPRKASRGDSPGGRKLIPSLRLSREDGMGKPYSMDLRERVVAAIEGGESTHQAAARFSIGIATAGTWARLKRATGDVRPAKQGKPKGAVLDAHADFILGALAEAPDTTLDEMVERLREERGVTVVRTAVWKLLDRHGQTHKKRPPTPASKSALM
jgi:transposase